MVGAPARLDLILSGVRIVRPGREAKGQLIADSDYLVLHNRLETGNQLASLLRR
jgi:hypothetical protein